MKNSTSGGRGREGVEEMAEKIEQTLNAFDVPIKVVNAIEGLHSYHFYLKTLKPIRMKTIESFEPDLRYALGSSKVEIQAPIPDEVLIGITVPKSDSVPLLPWSDAVQTDEFKDSGDLVVPLGQGEFGEEEFLDIKRAPHLLIGGTTGSGKSVLLHSIINSLLVKYSPDELRFMFVDPKRWDLVQYNGIPHLMTPVITDAKRVILALKQIINEMERRLDIFLEFQCLNISAYHENVYKNPSHKKSSPEPLPYILVVIDELSDLMSMYPRELEACIVRLTQKSRTVGIHLVLSTHHTSSNVVTALMKANIPTRIAFQTISSTDSRTILDQAGAEKLLGNGDMLILRPDSPRPVRLQGYFISHDDISQNMQKMIKKYGRSEENLLESIKLGNTASFYDDEDDGDDLFEEVKQAVIASGKASTSYLQRKFGIGYSRSARLIDILEEHGVIGPGTGSKPREVLQKKKGS